MGFIRPQDKVLVIGIGGVGHLGAQLLSRLTPGKIIAVDPREEARKLAARIGIIECYDSLDQLNSIKAGHEQGFRAILDFFGESDIPNNAIQLLKNQGRYLAIGTGGEVRISTAELVAREISIMGSFVGSFTSHDLCGSSLIRAPFAPPRLSVRRKVAADAQAVLTSSGIDKADSLIINLSCSI